MDLCLIDAIGPFFTGIRRKRINWSKIPFADLPPDGEGADERWAEIGAAMERFADRVAALGFNAATLDDVAHLADSDRYEPEVRERIARYRERFRPLVATLRARGLRVYLTMDVLSYTPALRARVGTRIGPVTAFLGGLLSGVFEDFPELAGVVMRVGESDGLDVDDDFRSQLVLKRPAHARRLLTGLLPLFERGGRELIFRTWTVGAYGIGDLIWHRDRFDTIFNAIDSPALTVSMKHGESDFYRYLPVNRHFFRLRLPVIVELQARREYEGCGEYPSYIGGDCEAIAAELRGLAHLRGISVWCQTGGWTPFRRLSFLEPAALWNEINTEVVVRIFRDGEGAAAALRACARERGIGDAEAFIELLEGSEEVVRGLLYIPEIAGQKLFFRRVRVPPLLSVFWNNIFVNRSLKQFFTHLSRDPEGSIRQGRELLGRIDEMEGLAQRAGLPAEDIRFMRDTFGILALAREYYFGPCDESIVQRLRQAKKAYKRGYPKRLRPRYRIKLNFEPFPVRGPRKVRWLLAAAFRRQRGYRIIDRLILLRLLAVAYWLVRRRKPDLIPKFARKTAMGIDTVFK